MSYLTDLFMPARPQAVTGTTSLALTDPAGWAVGTASGAVVTPETALKISTVWACIRLISDCVGMLPLIVYARLENGDRERATAHPLYDLLHDQPNYKQTAYQFKKMLTAHLLLRGNGYALIVPGPRGFADQLIPLHPERVTPKEASNGRLNYLYQTPEGRTVTHTDDEIFHLRGLSLDGVRGVGVIEYARETFGTALAREQYGARFFANDSTPGGLLKTAGKLSPEAAQRVGKSWTAAHAGARSAHKVAVLEEGLEYQAIGMTNKDAQFIELGEYNAEQIAGQWFGVPPHMVGLTSKATSWGSGIEEMSQGFVTYTLMPWLTEWEQSTSRDLILATQKYFAEFLPDALLKGRLLDRYNAYQIARNIGLMSPNEMRQKENMNRRTDPGGDQYQDTPAGAPTPAPVAELLSIEHQAPALNPSSARYAQLLLEAIGRAARKEAAAMSRAARRGSDWAQAVTEFYGEHAPYLAQILAVPVSSAEIYAAAQARYLLDGGPTAALAPDFEERIGATLYKLAGEDAIGTREK